MPERKYVLAIDGGGMRGIIQAVVLAAIEARTGRRVGELFDLIGGTSTGGLLALGMTKPDDRGIPEFSAGELIDLYVRHGDEIFPRSRLWQIRSLGGVAEERYDEGPLERVLRDRYFGETRLSSATSEVIITSYDLFASHPFIFKRSYALQRPEWDYPMWWVGRSTSAAPTYFEPFGIPARLPDEVDHVLVDGGVFANNPTLCAYVEALDLWGADAEISVCSLGTGEKPRRSLTKAQVDGWGAARWAPTILDTVFDGVADSVDYQMRVLCRHADGQRPRYRRFQITLPMGVDADLDNARPDQVARLRELGEELVELRRDELDALCAELGEPRPALAPT